ncbi:uncharacterized protein LOC134948455 isoform X2 [Pseudophryne corroboree]|uniref:uncharacterized protein LOC134948455 isoform X2 n=1 Tax=Pseudophryne corroboree TaxID=495146 RepID=UPI0030813905
MDVSGISNKKLDVFYNELRRKYPNTFNLATDLGKGDESVQKLPRLENTSSLTSLGILPKTLSHTSHQRWTHDSFLSKVQFQKTQNEQRQGAEDSQRSGGSIIIQDKIVSVSTWNRRDYLGAQNRGSFRLPTLRIQVEQNKAELKNRLNVRKKVDGVQDSNYKSNVETTEAGSTNKSISSQDPLGAIVKEILPNKPSRLITYLPKNTDNLLRNGGCTSDSDSGVSACTPIKILRPKINTHRDDQDLKDIKQKFSTKPKTSSGPMKADHMVLPENISQIVNFGKSPVKPNAKKSSINFNEKIPHRPARERVRFEDESEEEAHSRYQERYVLGRTHTTKMVTNISSESQIRAVERNSKPESIETSPSLRIGEKPPTTNQQTVTLPYRRQPFPPSVAKKVLIDIPSGGLPSKRAVPLRMYPAMRDSTNKPMSPRYGKEVASLDGITISCTSNSQTWREEKQRISEWKEENTSNQSLSSLETIGSEITEVSSEVTLMTMESGGSLSSFASENHTGSSSHDLKLDHPSLGKGANISFYSKVKRSLHVKRTTDTRQEKAVAHGKASLCGTTSPSPSSQSVRNESVPGDTRKNRVKMDIDSCAEPEDTDRSIPVKAPLFSMRMMQSLLKKKRAKDYLVSVPSATGQESRLIPENCTVIGVQVPIQMGQWGCNFLTPRDAKDSSRKQVVYRWMSP